MDAIYVLLTLCFFAAAIAYVRGCAAMGREDATDTRGHHER
jgi:hypothetical protein